MATKDMGGEDCAITSTERARRYLRRPGETPARGFSRTDIIDAGLTPRADRTGAPMDDEMQVPLCDLRSVFAMMALQFAPTEEVVATLELWWRVFDGRAIVARVVQDGAGYRLGDAEDVADGMFAETVAAIRRFDAEKASHASDGCRPAMGQGDPSGRSA